VPVLAAVPYTTFPTISLGPLELRTFGLMVAIGVLAGTWLGATYAERFGVDRELIYRLGSRMVLAGVIGARLTWVVTHLDQIDSPIDVIAVWEGGLQFAGGFLAALAVGIPQFLRWDRITRWHMLDAGAVGVTLGAAFGRIGCYAVGEHFGGETSFFLASRYDGGELREPFLGDIPLQEGMTFHNTSLYEAVWLFVLVALLWWALHRRPDPVPGTAAAMFLFLYAIARFVFDALRVNDERVLGLTGAQWMCVAMIPIGVWVVTRALPRNRREATPAPS
jgi:phosphatidylglycerol:prolipoprotein diacylglycerol transferase